MYELLVSGHYPAINEKDIPRNATIKIYVDDAINTKSITDTSLVVVDYLHTPVNGVVSYDFTNKGNVDSIPNILTFTPNSYLDPETTYFVYVNKFPDSIKSVNDTYIQSTYKFTFYTGISTIDNPDLTPEERLRLDLAAAIAREDWCEAARIQAILDGGDSACAIPSGIIPDPSGLLPDFLILENTNPDNMQSDIPLDKLRFVKLEFNDVMPASGVDYNSYISVITKGVLE